MITFRQIWNKIVKKADIISQVDPMRRVEMGHQIYQGMFNAFFSSLEEPTETEAKKYVIKQTYPSRLSSRSISTRFDPDDFSVNIQYHDTDIIKFLSDHLEIKHGGWATRSTVAQLNQWFSFSGLPFSTIHRFQRGSSSGTIFIKTPSATYMIDDGIMQLDYDTGQSSNYEPWEGPLRHEGSLKFADIISADIPFESLKIGDRVKLIRSMPFPRAHFDAGHEGTVVKLDSENQNVLVDLDNSGWFAHWFTKNDVRPIRSVQADIIQQVQPEDYEKYLQEIADQYPEYEHPSELEDIEEVEETPPGSISQESYPRMTPQEMLDAHREHVQGFDKFKARKEHEVDRDRTLVDEYDKETSRYAQRNGWDLIEDNNDYEYPKIIYAKKFVDGVQLVQINGRPKTDLHGEEIEEVDYDSTSWRESWDDIFSNQDIVKQIMENSGYSEFDEIDPMMYISWQLDEERYYPEIYNESGETAYKNMIKMMYNADKTVQPFNEGEFYPPKHWPHPKQKPDPSQYSLVDPEGKLLSEPKTEKEIRPQLYTGLTFRFMKIADIITNLRDIKTGDNVRIKTQFSLGGYSPADIPAVFQVEYISNIKTVRDRIDEGSSPRFNEVNNLPDDTKVYVVDFSWYLLSDLELVESKTADIISQPSINPQERPQMPEQSDSDGAVVYFDGGDTFKGYYNLKDLSAINKVAVADEQVGYLKGRRYFGPAGQMNPVVVYFKIQPDAIEIQQRRTNGFVGARWHFLPVEPLVHPTAGLHFQKQGDIIDSLRDLSKEEERTLILAPMNIQNSEWGIWWSDDTFVESFHYYEDAVDYIIQLAKIKNIDWEENDIPPIEGGQVITGSLKFADIVDSFRDLGREDDEPKKEDEPKEERTLIVAPMDIETDDYGVWWSDRTFVATLPTEEEDVHYSEALAREKHTSWELDETYAEVDIIPGEQATEPRTLEEPTQTLEVWVPLAAAYPQMHEGETWQVRRRDFGGEGQLWTIVRNEVGVTGRKLAVTINETTYNVTPPKQNEELYQAKRVEAETYQNAAWEPPTQASLFKQADWTAYLSNRDFDVNDFWKYARPNHVWAFMRDGEGQHKGETVKRFVRITSLDQSLGLVHGIYNYDLKEVMDGDKATGKPMDDEWHDIKFVQIHKVNNEAVSK